MTFSRERAVDDGPAVSYDAVEGDGALAVLVEVDLLVLGDVEFLPVESEAVCLLVDDHRLFIRTCNLTLPCSGMACTLLLCSDMAMIAMAMAADFDCQVIVFLCLCVFFMIPLPFIRYARGMTSCSVIYLTFYCIKNRMLFFSIGLNLPIYKRKTSCFWKTFLIYVLFVQTPVCSVLRPAETLELRSVMDTLDEVAVRLLCVEDRHALEGVDVALAADAAVLDGKGGLVAGLAHELGDVEVVGTRRVGHVLDLMAELGFGLLLRLDEFGTQLVVRQVGHRLVVDGV